jgi:hypothetical protein
VRAKVTTRKWLAINRVDWDYWAVTYIPMGQKIPGYFISKKDAIAAAKIARRIMPHPLNREGAYLQLPTNSEWWALLDNANIQYIK